MCSIIECMMYDIEQIYHYTENMLALNVTTNQRAGVEAGLVDVDLLARNKDLADKLGLIAGYYTMARDTYRAKSFTNATTQIGQYPYAIMSGAQARRDIKGIGDSIETAINEYLTTGTIQRLEELQGKFQEQRKTIDWLLSFYGIGPVTAIKLYNQGVRTLDDLWFQGNLTEAQKIGVMWRDHINLRIPKEEMNIIHERIGSILNPYVIKWNIAGSYRREETSSGDIDVLVESRPDFNMDGLIQLLKPILPATLAQGPTFYRGIVRIDDQHNGHRIDIRLVSGEDYPAALMYFTGSQRFNILMRQRAIEFGLTLNEYGLYNQYNQPQNVTSEEDIFRILRVQYIPPVQRTKTLATLTFI